MRFTQVPLDGIQSFWCVSCSTQLGVVCKLAEGALDLAIQVIDENVKQLRSQYGPLRDTTHHCCPLGRRAVDHYPLAVTFQPIPWPLNSPPIKSPVLNSNLIQTNIYMVLHIF